MINVLIILFMRLSSTILCGIIVITLRALSCVDKSALEVILVKLLRIVDQ